jgi:hypothetical protein
MPEPSTYVDEAYRIIHGAYPGDAMSSRERIEGIMDFWDGELFKADRQKEMVGRLALCHIGKQWFSGRVPHRFELIAERLRELMPQLEDEPVTLGMFTIILACHHPSQYATPRHR